jgi:hypothetical protein
MAKKSSFWRNFWGETGRNTGKWMSNKVFGNTGWATPRRHLLGANDSETQSGFSKRERRKLKKLEKDIVEIEYPSPKIIMNDTSELDFEKTIYRDEQNKEMLAKIKAIKFGNSHDDIINALDDLLVLYKRRSNYEFKDAIYSKAQIGLHKLKQIGTDQSSYDLFKKQFNTKTDNELDFVSYIKMLFYWLFSIIVYVLAIYLIYKLIVILF